MTDVPAPAPVPHVETFHQLHDGTPIRLVCFCGIGRDHVTTPSGTPPRRAPVTSTPPSGRP
ncbi:hypothetical protein [Curtobacterium sp. PhB115]|uniref:hypothetical protein n=1 Tax=Curtobacterium sp. PhB115 TaxID=2485173 RepID=UPI000F4AFD5A|nr:hypothetical protein [Curtobacterium sp. PhB115]ROP66891.1 hypothetical protein EDF19_2233 [Curtobacterium sp. PhB115]